MNNLRKNLERKFVKGIEYVYDGNDDTLISSCTSYWITPLWGSNLWPSNSMDASMSRDWTFNDDSFMQQIDVKTDYGHLQTNKIYHNFHLHIEFKTQEGYEEQQAGSNSGIMLFGNEIQILNTCTTNLTNTCGALYNTGGVGDVGVNSFNKSNVVNDVGYLADKWNIFDIFCTGEKKISSTNEYIDFTNTYFYINGIPAWKAIYNTPSIYNTNNIIGISDNHELLGTPIRIQFEKGSNPPSFRNLWVSPISTDELFLLDSVSNIPTYQTQGLSYPVQ